MIGSGPVGGPRLFPPKIILRTAVLAAASLTGSFLTIPGRAEGQTIRGRLLDNQSGRPVVLGNVALMDSMGAVVRRSATSTEGKFILPAPGSGVYSVLATGLGYRSTPSGKLVLAQDEELFVEIYLHPKPIEMEPLLVTAERVRKHLESEGFYERRASGKGFFLSPDELRRRPPINEIEVIRRAPFVYLNPKWDGSTIIMKSWGRDCVPTLFVDGSEVHWLPERAGVVEDWVNFADIVALEVFRGQGEIPLRWAGWNDDCGVILVWTVWGEQRARSRGSGLPGQGKGPSPLFGPLANLETFQPILELPWPLPVY